MATTVDSLYPPDPEDLKPEDDEGDRRSGPRPRSTSGLRLIRDDENASKTRTIVRSAVRRSRRPVADRTTRERDIDRIVSASLKKHREQENLLQLIRQGTKAGVVQEMPERQFAKIKPGPPPEIPRMKLERFHASFWRTLVRCTVWFRVYLLFQSGVLWDKLRRKDSVDARATRLLQLFQGMGGSFIKIGQQLAMRIDVLPYEYCRELSKLFEKVTPFEFEKAREAVERMTKKPLAETFLLFDPTPIGSASIACVYQAVLKNGQKVAVKVRRPGIGEMFAADLKAMSWLINTLENSSIVRPGYMQNFVREFEETIMEELDFRMEAYHQSLFVRESKKFKVKNKQVFFAPETFYELSGTDVIVQEFVSGMWMWEVLAAVERHDPDATKRMHQLRIEPKLVAERLMYAQFWGQLVSPIFHADPHPSNIVIQEDSKLVFIDFGACGSMDRIKKELVIEQLEAAQRKDLNGLVQSMLSFMEPLPPIDVDQFAKELEIKIGANMQKVWSKHAQWYEKTTAANWFSVFDMTQQYQIPVNLDTVRAFRANMLYDTLALRTCPELDLLRTGKKFLRHYDANAKRKAGKALRKRLAGGLIAGSEVRAIGDLMGLLGRSLKTVGRLVDRPVVNFTYMIEKSVYAVLEVSRLIRIVAVITVVASAGVALYFKAHKLPMDPWLIVSKVLLSNVFYGVVGVIALITARRIMLRLRDREVE